MAITESMHPILQEIERAYSEAHRRVRNVELWEEEHWGIIDDAFMSANNRIAALEAQVERYRAAIHTWNEARLEEHHQTWSSCGSDGGLMRAKHAREDAERTLLVLATAGPGGGGEGES